MPGYNAYAWSDEMQNPYQRIAAMYDEIIRFVSQAKSSCNGNARVNPIDSAIEIVSMLERSLSPVDVNLYEQFSVFYASLIKRLYEVKFKGSEESCESIIRDLNEVKSGWLEAEKLVSRLEEESIVSMRTTLADEDTANASEDPDDRPSRSSSFDVSA